MTKPQPRAARGRHARGTLAAVAAAAAFAIAAQEPGGIMQLNGTWERYPSIASGLDPDPTPPAVPAAVPDPPLKPEYLAEWRASAERARELSQEGVPPPDLGSSCLPQGMPGMMTTLFPMELLVTPGQVTIIQEAFTQVRRIYLDEELVAAEDAEPRFSGHSVGRWEGETLVVETVGVKDYVRFRNVPHSTSMRIVERIRLVDRDYIENVVTVTDPAFLTAPWTWTWMYRRWPGYKLQEYVCEDNRYDPSLDYQRLRVEPAP